MLSRTTIIRSLLAVCFIYTQYNSAYAQTEPTDNFVAKKNAIKISPTAFFVSTFALSYERHLSKAVSLQLTGGLTARERDSGTNFFSGSYNSSDSKDKVSGWFTEGMLRIYFVKGRSVLSGLYAGPYGRYTANDFTVNYRTDNYGYPYTYSDTANYSTATTEGGFVIGWQWVIKNAVLLDMYAGGGLRASTSSNKPADYGRDDYSFEILESEASTGVVPKVGFRAGFVF